MTRVRVSRARDCITAKKCAYESKEGQEPNERESLLRNVKANVLRLERRIPLLDTSRSMRLCHFFVSNIILSKHILEQIAYIYQLDNEACTSNANYWKVIRHGG